MQFEIFETTIFVFLYTNSSLTRIKFCYILYDEDAFGYDFPPRLAHIKLRSLNTEISIKYLSVSQDPLNTLLYYLVFEE